ncbi:MAG: hypothetical protein BGO95_01955 [Micrococcales bacterium 73-13]|nr:MAG: hypothetical protein BGO95_01955 [Micrococcales bacterium 73-13]
MRRFTPTSVVGLAVFCALAIVLAILPYLIPLGQTSQLTTLFIYIVIASAWNLLAGYGGMVSIGQQAYIGLGAYSIVTLVGLAGLNPILSIPIAALVCAIIALPISYLVFRLVGGYFAVGTWVISEILRLTTMRIPAVGAGNGMSIQKAVTQALPDRDLRIAITYWVGLALVALVIVAIVLLVRSKLGLALTAVRDEPIAAATSGVNVVTARRVVFIVAAGLTGAAGAVLAVQTLNVLPTSVYSVNYAAFMIFMVVIGGVGSIEGPIIGAAIFWTLEQFLKDYGPAYLIGLGLLAIVMVLFAPGGIWGLISGKRQANLFPIGYRLDRKAKAEADGATAK